MANNIRKLITFIGLVVLGIYAAAHVGTTLASYEKPWLGAMAALAFVCLEYSSVANLVQADTWTLRAASLATYVVMLLSLGGMREWYFTREVTWLTGRTLAWWVTGVGIGAGVQGALVLRASAREADNTVEKDKERADNLQLRLARMQEREETKRQVALARVKTVQTGARPAIAQPTNGNGRVPMQERRKQLSMLLQQDPQSALQDFAPVFGCSISTLSRDAKAIGLVYEGGLWRNNGHD